MTFAVMMRILLCLLSAPAFTRETVTSRRETASSPKALLTILGKECKFPFRQGGQIHHSCITVIVSRPWCSLTSNFDRDRLWGYCALEQQHTNGSVHTSRRIINPCKEKPCHNGGTCIPHKLAFECLCPEKFSGKNCEHKKCYETVHLHYYVEGESWGRIYLRNVEQCTCIHGQIECQRVRYTTCRSNPCQNDGTCRMIIATGKEVCNCRKSYSGPLCSFEPDSECYSSRGTNYRGMVSSTVSGTQCLPWNSDLLYNELHVGTVQAAPLRGLGEHAYCRNPDGDKMPWCYTLNKGAISWEYCDVLSCKMPFSSSRRMNMFNTLPGLGNAKPSKPASKKAVCGTKHKKRVSVARGRIMGGNAALPGTHPWMAAIYYGESEFCAGTLIASCWVVSAAHCLFRNPLTSQLRVVLGQHHFNVSGRDTRTFGVDKYIFPKQFSVFNPTLHDIVLIKLKKQNGQCVKRTQFIRPICLPDGNVSFPDGYCCTISGWGRLHEKADGYSNLQEAGVRLIRHDVCRKPEVFGNHVTANMICAGLNGCVDACQGDSGGPLACSRNDVSFLYGIISWGEGCGNSKKPGVYTKVANYMDWINSVIKPKPKTT
ncbi:hepatocyte growth factor activator isoform X2 [Nerophis ophidion]|uniref:hepatocyte growth factor activator isoform X2 n=1 Tax=Nerophis ophidion TaxID=159077 RepID=UPI002ADFB1E6|nr:hepatocyte growth factor activator isoform X2 [Nerophis ophidion]